MKGTAVAALAGWGSISAVPSSCCSACLVPGIGKSNRSALLSCEGAGDQTCLAFARSVCEELRIFQKKKRPLNQDIDKYLLLWCLFISICLWCCLVSKCFFLVDTSLLANVSRTSFSYFHGSPGRLAVPPSAPVCSTARLKVSAGTWDLPSSLRDALHHTGRFRCFTGRPETRHGHCCCCCSRSGVL